MSMNGQEKELQQKIINLTILECKSESFNRGDSLDVYNKSNHIGM